MVNILTSISTVGMSDGVHSTHRLVSTHGSIRRMESTYGLDSTHRLVSTHGSIRRLDSNHGLNSIHTVSGRNRRLSTVAKHLSFNSGSYFPLPLTTHQHWDLKVPFVFQLLAYYYCDLLTFAVAFNRVIVLRM